VILPLVVLRRLDCVREPTKEAVLVRNAEVKRRVENVEPVLNAVSGQEFYNTSPLDFRRLLDDPANVSGNLRSYIAGFSRSARDAIDKFGFDAQIAKLAEKDLLEPGMNGFPESETAERFATDDHQVLVVAEKFQTGFDQPLLHTMYVD
jgi:type I restriction enzyme M protein